MLHEHVPEEYNMIALNNAIAISLSLLKWNRIYALILLYEVQLLAVTTGISTHPTTVIVNHDPEAPALKGGPTNGDLC